ncbi:MAG: hypothetical protein NVSMB52_15900 [Chloroflexota bacterium]
MVDFKSGMPRTREDMEASIQLPVYALAAAEQLAVPYENLSCTYYFLRNGTELTFYPTEESAEYTRNRVDGLLEAIQNEKFEPAEMCNCFACRRGIRAPSRLGGS